jgi:SRSO17 transposase
MRIVKTEAESMVEPRSPTPTVKFVDEYCQLYQKLFPEVRSFEAFKETLHLGIVKTIRGFHLLPPC